MSQQQSWGKSLKLYKRHSVGDIRTYFEKKSADTPKLVKYTKKRSTSGSGEYPGHQSPKEDTITLNLQLSTEKSTSRKPLTRMQTANKKSKGPLQQLTKAVGEMVGITGGPVPSVTPSTTSADTTTTAAVAATNPPTTPAVATPSTPATPINSTSTGQYKDYLTIGGTVGNTPFSEAASMEGDLSGDENIQLLDAGDGNINMIQLEDGSSAIVCSEASQVPASQTQSQPLPQRMMTRRTASTKNSPLTSKKITTTPVGGGKRALPFTSPNKGLTQANKAARGSSSKPPSSNDDSDDGGMSVDLPTTKKKTSCPNDTCQQMRQAMEEVMQKLKKLEMDHTYLASSFDAYSASEIEQVQALTNKFMVMDANLAHQVTEHNRLATQVGEISGSVQVLHHDIQKTQQGVMELSAKQDSLVNQWATMKEQIQSSNTQSRAQPEQDTALFLGGIQTLREFFNRPDSSDPAQIVRDLLTDIHLYCSLDKTYIADGQARTSGDRRQARAMILVMRSAQHKKEAIIRIKRYLSQFTIKNVTVSDIFPADQMDMVKKLSKYAQHKKASGVIIKYRVINKNNRAALQTQKNNREPFKDDNPTDEQLSSFLSTLHSSQPMDTDTNTGSLPPVVPTTGRDTASNNSSRPRQDNSSQHRTTQNRSTNNRPSVPPRTTATHSGTHNRNQQPQPRVPQPTGNSGTNEEAMRRQLERVTREAEFYKRMAASARQTSGREGPPPTPLLGADNTQDGAHGGPIDGIQPLRNN